MKSILEELYMGNVDPNTSYIKQGSTYAKNMAIVADNEDKLLKLLDEDCKRLFIDFSSAHSTINALGAIEKFSIGFKLGSLLMIEVFTGMAEVVQE